MYLECILTLLLIPGSVVASANVEETKLKNLKNIAMTEKEYKRVQQLHYGWYIQAVSALLGAMGKEMYMKMDRNNRRAFVACLDGIEKEHDLQSGAKCLVKAFDKKLEETMEEAKRSDRMDSPYKPTTMDKLPSLMIEEKTPVKMVTKLLGSLWRTARNETDNGRIRLKGSFSRLQQLQEKVIEMKRETQFKHRMLDMVVGKNNPLKRRKSFTDRFRDLMPEKAVDKNVYGLVDAVSRHTKDVNSQMLSPRILPLMPDKYSVSKKLLSPDLFPLYKDDTGNSILSIPKVLEESGLDTKDRDAILELVMDVTGVNDVVEKSMDLLDNIKTLNLGKDLAVITKVLDDAFVNIKNNLRAQQRQELASRQFTFLDKPQLDKLYGREGLLNTTIADFPFDLDEYGGMNQVEREESLRTTVRILADDPQALHRRFKRTIDIKYFNHVTLSPYAFAPTVNTLNVLGPVTLSPSLFSPNIVSPLLLSPPTISPQVGNPLILSPYVLGPNTLSAAVFNTYILSPYVLSPNVINPYVLSPLILSPYVLCPDVLSPTILSGAILSPSVLSPAVFTESALAINVLSPSFLS
ncbi:unnamed protein product [Cylicocyclus nassatus]|uniref:Uncharacterized protein n=1 Tax=Cylicocyclus nassatus TaxID=53992 RepID=A0AA36H4F3_CYLNA|nr:unnamed protein product [Cylicocyclus nassatus]